MARVMPPQPAQAFQTTYAPRIRQFTNSLAAPVTATQTVQGGRTTKRGTTVINYADDAYDDDDFDESDSAARRPTGLRSLRREESEKRDSLADKLGKEIYEPTDLQPIYRHWIADTLRQRKPPTVQGAHAQAQFPLTLIPIRIEYEVSQHQQDLPFPIPPRQVDGGNFLTNPAYRRPEPSPGYKIRDIFMWNLHETLFTPDDFALAFVQDLDLPSPYLAVTEIAKQIRTQLEDYAGVALHPLFHTSKAPKPAPTQKALTNGASSRMATPRPTSGYGTPMRDTPALTPAPETPAPQPQITAEATPIDDILNQDETYRCIINLSIYHASRLYQDKFEWSLLHPPGFAETFAKQTAADMGLNGEWVLAITHAIYEAVLKLKKETCEGGNAVGLIWAHGLDNQAIEGSGWRYDEADFGAEWEPRLENLSKEEIEKREYDRERQLRRQRRDMGKMTSTTGVTPSLREQEAQMRGSYFEPVEDVLGRGERNRKKRRVKSPSPVTPEPDAGWGGEAKAFPVDADRSNWRCSHCQVWGSAVWAVRNGPKGARTLCNNCGLLYERNKELPAWNKDLHKNRPKIAMQR